MAAKSTKKRKNTKSRPNKKQQDNGLKSEIIILASLAVCILLVLSNFGVGGIVGEAVSSEKRMQNSRLSCTFRQNG